MFDSFPHPPSSYIFCDIDRIIDRRMGMRPIDVRNHFAFTILLTPQQSLYFYLHNASSLALERPKRKHLLFQCFHSPEHHLSPNTHDVDLNLIYLFQWPDLSASIFKVFYLSKL